MSELSEFLVLMERPYFRWRVERIHEGRQFTQMTANIVANDLMNPIQRRVSSVKVLEGLSRGRIRESDGRDVLDKRPGLQRQIREALFSARGDPLGAEVGGADYNTLMNAEISYSVDEC